jgi:hypothetical protein
MDRRRELKTASAKRDASQAMDATPSLRDSGSDKRIKLDSGAAISSARPSQ